MKKVGFLILLTLFGSLAFAHPGHGTQNPLSPGHYLGNPEHALPVTLSIIGGFVLVTLLWRKYSGKRT